GISQLDIILDMAVGLDIIKKSGSWYSYNSEKIAQGSEKTKAWLLENPAILKEVEEILKQKVSPEILESADIADPSELDDELPADNQPD
ncbi:MAG TPA: DNA recombination/repair protein RecA, partial [Candidatus Cloacimonadota bacterium]|nr:DNA recombination/repair protein RecA [Candidatus Cloacimonadota bacterium]